MDGNCGESLLADLELVLVADLELVFVAEEVDGQGVCYGCGGSLDGIGAEGNGTVLVAAENGCGAVRGAVVDLC